jgi:hypothetical protein
MDQHQEAAAPGVAALAREMGLVDSAITMVAAGGAPRMQLGGLAFGDVLLDYARRTAAGRPVRVTPVWGVGEEGLALTFEREDVRSGETRA